MTTRPVTFKSFGVNLVGDLYLPDDFDESEKYKAIVGASPFPQVKDQIPATYGPEMAARGFIYLGFDYLGMGESPALPGEFKQSRYMFRLIENTWDAISYLGTLSFVDESKSRPRTLRCRKCMRLASPTMSPPSA